jgi:hypothetical protein
MAFPSGPVDQQQATVNGIIYIYSSAKGVWNRLAVTGNTITANSLALTSGTDSSNFSTGALAVTGGAGISKNLYVQGNAVLGSSTTSNLVAAATTDSTSSTTGALVVVGGAGIAGNLNVAGNVNLTAQVILGSGSTNTNVVAAATTVATTNNTGALVVNGGLGIAGNLIYTNSTLKVNSLGSVSGSVTIDLSLGNYVTATAIGNCTWTVVNYSGSGYASGFLLELTDGGAYTQTWMVGTKWPVGTAPTLTFSGVDLLGFVTDDSGTTWRGVVNMSNSA